MNVSPELKVLAWVATITLLMWVPYMTARIITRGPWRTLGNPEDETAPADPAWARRARRAHANAVENLVVFAALVLILDRLGAGTSTTLLAAQVYLWARVIHYVVYAGGITAVRTLAFVTGAAATLVIAIAVIEHA